MNYLFLNNFLHIFICRKGDILGLAMACSNTFGLVTGAFLLGYGLSEIPKSIWRNADWTTRQKVLSHKIAKITAKLDDAHQELSNAIVVSNLLKLFFFYPFAFTFCMWKLRFCSTFSYSKIYYLHFESNYMWNY